MPLEEMIRDGNFREDLLYRINTVEIMLPPLRERAEDIPILAEHFLNQYADKYRKASITFSDESIAKMKEYAWPGNVRELQHAVERAVIMADSNVIAASDLLFRKTAPTVTTTKSLNVEDIEKSAIEAAIEKHRGNLSNAAKELGMGRTTLYRKLERYNIKP